MTMKWHQSAGGDNDDTEWKPEGAGSLVGVLVGKRTVNTKYGETTILRVEAEDGETYTVWCSRTGLKNLVAEHDEDLILGREIGIKTTGPQKLPDSNNTFFPYELGFGEFTQAKASAMAGADEPF